MKIPARRKSHYLTGPQLLWDMEDIFGEDVIKAYGVLQPMATFQHGRMDGTYNGDVVIVTLDKKEGPPTLEQFYFPVPSPRIYLTKESSEEEVLELLALLGRPK